VLVERNYGFELERRELATGELDSKTIFLGSEPVDLDAVRLSNTSCCVPGRQSVAAYSRDDGKRLWETRLPLSGLWQVMPTRSALLVFPRESIPLTDGAAAKERAWNELVGVPTPERMHTAAAILYHGWMRRTFPLFLLDPIDGRVLARRDFPGHGPRAAVLIGERQAAVAVEGSFVGLSQ